MLLPSMTSKRIACGPPFHNFTFYSIPRMAQRKKRLRDKPLSLFREVLLYPYRAHRAGVGGVHSQRHLVGRDVAGDGDSQSPFHLVYLGAEPGALGAADAEFRVYECFHVGTTSIQNKKRR